MAVNDLYYYNHSSVALNLNDGTTFTLAKITGIYTSLVHENVAATIPRRRPAGIYLGSNPKERKVTVTLVVRSSSPAGLITALAALYEHLYSDPGADSQGALVYTSLNGYERVLDVIPDPSDDPDDWFVPGAGRSLVTVTLNFIAQEPSFYDIDSTISTSAFNGTSPVSLGITNYGDVDAWAIIQYVTDGSHTLENPMVTDAYGHYLLMELTMAVSKTMLLSLWPQNISMVYNSTNVYGLRSSGSQIVLIAPGTNNLTFTADNVDANAAITVAQNDRYSGHGR
jgi:hypothetical protein